MTEADEPTAKSPTAPKRGRPKKNTSPADAAILVLQQQIAELTARLNKTPVIEDVTPGPEVAPGEIPGEYVVSGKDPSTGQPVLKKRRWSHAEIERRYGNVTFTPMVTMPVKPHGITRGGWDLIAGQTVTVPSIVKDIYDNSVASIVRQTAAYPGASPDLERAIFDAASKSRGPHFTPVKHVGFGWSESALRAAAAGRIDPTHEPELGFPSGDEVKV